MYDLTTAETYVKVDRSKLPILTEQSLTTYSPPKGLEKLVSYLAKLEGVDIENIVIGPSAKYLFRSIISQGGDLLLITPYWPGYETSTDDLDCEVHLFDVLSSNLDVNIKELSEYLDNNKGIKFVTINNPNNPTGYIFSEESIRNIYKICYERNILLVVDQAYIGVNFDSEPIFDAATLIKKDTKNLLILNTATKIYGLLGLRVGWVIASKQLCIKVEEYIQNTITCTPTVTQEIFLNVLKNKDVVHLDFNKLKIKRDELVDVINNSKNLELLHPPLAGTTLLAKIPDHIDDEVLQEALIQNESIEITPGSQIHAPGYIRLTFSNREEMDLKSLITKIDLTIEDL